MDTIFTLFSGLTDKLGISQQWLAAVALNAMSVTSIARAKYASISGFWPTTGVVVVSSLLMALPEYYTNLPALATVVLLVWAGTTLAMKGGEKLIDMGRKGFDRPPTKNPNL